VNCHLKLPSGSKFTPIVREVWYRSILTEEQVLLAKLKMARKDLKQDEEKQTCAYTVLTSLQASHLREGEVRESVKRDTMRDFPSPSFLPFTLYFQISTSRLICSVQLENSHEAWQQRVLESNLFEPSPTFRTQPYASSQ
jgi:hypothetical protein